MRRPLPPLLAAALLAAAGTACDPQVTAANYQGEPIFAVEGRVTGGPTLALPPVEAALLWQRGPPPTTDDVELAVRVPIPSGGDGTFTLALYTPPPAAAYRTLAPGEPRVARGNAAAVPFGVASDAVPMLPTAGSPSYGVDVAHWIVYLDRAAPAGSLTAWWLGAALPAGFHLLRVTEVPCPAAEELAACVATVAALGAPTSEGSAGADQPTADALCNTAYRLGPAPAGERVELALGTVAPQAGTCP